MIQMTEREALSRWRRVRDKALVAFNDICILHYMIGTREPTFDIEIVHNGFLVTCAGHKLETVPFHRLPGRFGYPNADALERLQ